MAAAALQQARLDGNLTLDCTAATVYRFPLLRAHIEDLG